MSGNRRASTQPAGGRAVATSPGLDGLHPILWEALVGVAPAPACPPAQGALTLSFLYTMRMQLSVFP